MIPAAPNDLARFERDVVSQTGVTCRWKDPAWSPVLRMTRTRNLNSPITEKLNTELPVIPNALACDFGYACRSHPAWVAGLECPVLQG